MEGMYRKVLAAAGVVVAIATLAACGSSDDESSTTAQSTAAAGTTSTAQASADPLKVAYFAPVAGNAYFSTAAKAGEEWAEANDAEFTVLDPGYDVQKQLNQIEDANATGKYNAYIVFAAGGPMLAAPLKEAADDGTPVVLMNSTVSPDFQTAALGADWLSGRVAQPPAARGATLGKQAAAACEGIDPCEVVYLYTIAGDPQEKVIIESFRKELEAHPNVKVLKERGPAMAQRGPAGKVTQDLLQAEPGVDVIASLDQSIAGAELAIKQAGKTAGTGEGEIRLVGTGATATGVNAVKAGRWASTQLDMPADVMDLALDMVKQAHDGEMTEPKGVDPTVDSEYPLILDKQALEDSGFQAQYDG